MLQAIQEMVDFYHNKGNDMLKLGCTLAKLAKILIRSHSLHFHPSTERGFIGKKRQDRVGTPSVASTRKDVVVEILFRDSTN